MKPNNPEIHMATPGFYVDEKTLKLLECRSIESEGFTMDVDAGVVNILISAYLQRNKLQNDLADIKEGRCVVVPKTPEHAEAMRAVGEAFGKAK